MHNPRPTLLTAARFHYIVSGQTAHRPREHPGHHRHSELWKYLHNKILIEDGWGRAPEEPSLRLVVNEDAIKRDAIPH